jgi:hypothetical protein
VAVLGGKIYVLGGEEGWDHYHDTIECYDPVVNKWELVGEMGSSRSWLSCVGKEKYRAKVILNFLFLFISNKGCTFQFVSFFF